jgi:AraC-like DNA-binding protein
MPTELTGLARIPLVLRGSADGRGRRASMPTPPATLAVPDLDARVPISVLAETWRDLLRRDPDPALGLRVGRRIDVRSLGLVGYIAASSRTLGDALDRVSRYYRLLHEGVDCRIERGDGRTTILLHDQVARHASPRHEVDVRLAALLAGCREITKRDIVPDGVSFPYPRPRRIEQYRRTFRTGRLYFDQPRAAVVLPTSALGHSVWSADDTLAFYLERLATEAIAGLGTGSSGPFAAHVTDAIGRILQSEMPTIATVGALLGLRPRTVQHRLRSEGTTFAALLDDVRRAQAERLLRAGQATIEEIATRLGYSEPSTFYRAFRRWRGTTPARFRANLGSHQSGA